MKKIVIFLMSFFISANMAMADNKTITHDMSQLPAESQKFISTHFSGADISHIVIEKNLLGVKGYDVILTNGVDIEFDKSGEWKEVDGNQSIVPSDIVPEVIASYLRTHFSKNEVVKIEKEWRKYDIKLNNGLELTFDKKGNIVEIDD